MKQNLFRKASLDRVNSPEQLNDYIRVVRPSVWVTLAAIIILLVGIVVWGVFGTIQTEVKTAARVEANSGVCYCTAEQIKTISPGMNVRVGEASGTVQSTLALPVELDTDVMLAGGLSKEFTYYPVRVMTAPIKDGVYECIITVESIHPISFLLK